MKNFELTLIYRSNNKIKSIDKIEADDLIQLLSQFNMMILMLQRTIHENQISVRIEDNDIPF